MSYGPITDDAQRKLKTESVGQTFKLCNSDVNTLGAYSDVAKVVRGRVRQTD